MGPPDRISFSVQLALLFGITVATFPYAVSIGIYLGPVAIHIGLGPDYLQQDRANG